jgi:hypothetical protein
MGVINPHLDSREIPREMDLAGYCANVSGQSARAAGAIADLAGSLANRAAARRAMLGPSLASHVIC